MTATDRRVNAARWRSARNAIQRVLPDLWGQTDAEARAALVDLASRLAYRRVRPEVSDVIAALDQILDRAVLSDP